MDYRRMGRAGLKLSAISIGAWVTFGAQIGERAAGEILQRAYDLGVNFFDNGDAYADGQAEIVMGKAVRSLRREALVISSKVFWLVRRVVEDEVAPLAADLGLGLVTWSPLRSGLLSGKYLSGIPQGARLSLKGYTWLRDLLTEENLRKVRELQAVAADLGVTLPQLAIGWLLRLPGVTSVITGATKVSQLEENVKALEVPRLLTPEVLERIEAILGNKPEEED